MWSLPIDVLGLLCAAGGECKAKQAPGGGHAGCHRQAAGRTIKGGCAKGACGLKSFAVCAKKYIKSYLKKIPLQGVKPHSSKKIPLQGGKPHSSQKIPLQGGRLQGTQKIPPQGAKPNGSQKIPLQGVKPHSSQKIPLQGVKPHSSQKIPLQGVGYKAPKKARHTARRVRAPGEPGFLAVQSGPTVFVPQGLGIAAALGEQ